jgi:anti-sigma regulatory factor (Ser/Thr protein kinase)
LCTAPEAVELAFTIDELGVLRGYVKAALARTSLDAERASDLLTAVNELATNSICHGGGQGTLRLWCDDRTLLIEVRDRGHMGAAATRLRDERPRPDAMTGRGLWLVDQLCDTMQISSSPQDGSTVRLHMQLP